MNIGSLLGMAGSAVSGGLLKKLLPLAICGAVLGISAVGYIVLKNAREAGAAQVEAVRLADAAAATAETLERTKASAEALSAAQAASHARVREAEGEAGDLKLRLSTALQDAEEARLNADLARETADRAMGALAEGPPPVSWEGKVCPIGCVVPVPVAQ